MATRHCYHCGWEWTYSGVPGRNDSCERCGADLRVCLNCARYDAGAAYQCREPRAEPVADKDRSNYCEWFEFARRVFVPKGGKDPAAEARERLRRLLGPD